MGHNITHLLDSLGWALVHSLWQGGLAFIIVVIIRVALKNNAPSLRYAVQLSVLIACFVAFLATFGLYFKAGLLAGGETVSFQTGIVAPLAELTAPLNLTFSNGISAVQSSLTSDAASLAPLIGVLWCLGFLFMALRYAGAFMLTQRLRRAGLSAPSAAWTKRFNTLVLNAGLPSSISLHISQYVSGPVTLGFLKPVVLVPVGFLTGLPQDQVEAILLHEIAHIRRYDYAMNLVQTAIKTVFFFHPAIHYISRRIDIDREQACDDLAVAQGRNPKALAKGLASLRLQTSGHGLALNAAGDTPLLDRLARLAGYSESARRSEHMIISAMTALLIGSLYVGATASANAHPDNESDILAGAPETYKNSDKSYNHADAALKNYTFKSARINGHDVVLKISEDGRRWINVEGMWHDVDKNPSMVSRSSTALPQLPKAPKFNNIDFAGNMDEKRLNKLMNKDANAWGQFQIDMTYFEQSLENYAHNNAVNEDVVDRLEDKADRLADRAEDRFEQRQDRLEEAFERHHEAKIRHSEAEQRRKDSREREQEARERAQEMRERAQEERNREQENRDRIREKLHEKNTHKTHTQLHGKLYTQLLTDAMISSKDGSIKMKYENDTWTVNGVAVPVKSESEYCNILSDMGVRKSALTEIKISPNSTHIISKSKNGKSRQTYSITHGEFKHSHYGDGNQHEPVPPVRPVTPIAPVPAFIVPTVSPKVHVKFGMTDPVWAKQHTHAHNGIDLGAKAGTPVYASSDGEVSIVATEPQWGNRVTLKHAEGYQTFYGHLNSFSVTQGQTVSAGQVIGTVGSTGQSSGPHLHFEIRKDGTPIDPSPLIF